MTESTEAPTLEWFVPDDPGWFTNENYDRLQAEFKNKKIAAGTFKFFLAKFGQHRLEQNKAEYKEKLATAKKREKRTAWAFEPKGSDLLCKVALCEIRFQGKGEENKSLPGSKFGFRPGDYSGYEKIQLGNHKEGMGIKLKAGSAGHFIEGNMYG